jgi:hypothetical protein
MVQINNMGDAWFNGVVNFINRLLGFLPNLIGAIILLIIGWIISSVIARVLGAVLEAVGFERAVDRAGISSFLRRTGSQVTAISLLTGLLKWFIRLIFVEAAASTLNFAPIITIVNDIVAYLPNVFVAILIIVIGALLARIAGDLVRAAISGMGVGNAGLFAALVMYLIIGAAVVAALDQLMIAATVVNTLFIALVASVALAFALAFGLGARDVAGDIARSWYESGRTAASRVAAGPASRGPASSTSTTDGVPGIERGAYPQRRS